MERWQENSQIKNHRLKTLQRMEVCWHNPPEFLDNTQANRTKVNRFFLLFVWSFRYVSYLFVLAKTACVLSRKWRWQWVEQAYTIVATPAGNSVGCIFHLLQGLGTQVAQLPQAAVMEHPSADPAGVQVIGRPHLTHITHLIARWLR